MLKADVLEKLKTQAAVARTLGISEAAVSKWPDVVPELRQYQLREKRPDLFPAVDAEEKGSA